MPTEFSSLPTHIKPKMKHSAATLAALSIVLLLAAPPARAANKDMVQLQTQVQELQTAVARLQQSNDERMGVSKGLVQQTADSVNKMSLSIGTLQQQLTTQHDSTNAKLDQFSAQLQTLGDSLDEVKARLNNLEKGLNPNRAGSSPSTPHCKTWPRPVKPRPLPWPRPRTTPFHPRCPPGPPPAPVAAIRRPSALRPPFLSQRMPILRPPPLLCYLPVPPRLCQPPAHHCPRPQRPPRPPSINRAQRLHGRQLRAGLLQFAAIVTAYPTDPYAGNSLYYLAEIDYRGGKYATAIKDYDRVLSPFPNNPKVPSATCTRHRPS